MQKCHKDYQKIFAIILTCKKIKTTKNLGNFQKILHGTVEFQICFNFLLVWDATIPFIN